MIRKVVFDTSVYVEALRKGDREALATRVRGATVLYFSAVVGSELLRGAHTSFDQRTARKLWRDFEGADRLIVPNSKDWYEAGLVLLKLAKAA